jgi:hypothetical protein
VTPTEQAACVYAAAFRAHADVTRDALNGRVGPGAQREAHRDLALSHAALMQAVDTLLATAAAGPVTPEMMLPSVMTPVTTDFDFSAVVTVADAQTP